MKQLVYGKKKSPLCLNYLAVELYKRIEWGYSTTQIWRLLGICVRVHATPAGLNSCSASSSSLSLKCDLFLYFWCVVQTLCVCVCVWSLHFHCSHNSSFACCWYKTVGVCFVSRWLVNFLMCLFSLGALPCQTIWRGELLGGFKRPLGL